MRRSFLLPVSLSIFVLAGYVGIASIVIGQEDTFDSDAQGWTTGGVSPNPPAFVADGGPNGIGDGYLESYSNGNAGPGGALVTFNTAQWAGDYTAAGVGSISIDLKNLGTTDLDIRLLVENGGLRLFTADSVHLPVGSPWTSATFGLDSASVETIGGASYAVIMANVTRLRVFHGTTDTFPPDYIEATLGFDNVKAGTVLPVELVSFDAVVNNGTVGLRWRTASEVNNSGFEVLEESNGTRSFESVGFVEGQGDNSSYSFSLERPVGDYRYRLRQVDVDGTSSLSPVVELSIAPELFTIEPAYPNPTDGATTIDVLSPEPRLIRASIVDLLGREVRVVFDSETSSTRTSIEIDTDDLAAGSYLLRVDSEGTMSAQLFVVRR